MIPCSTLKEEEQVLPSRNRVLACHMLNPDNVHATNRAELLLHARRNDLVNSYDVHLVEIANIVWGRNNLMTVQTLWVYLNFEQCKLWVDKP